MIAAGLGAGAGGDLDGMLFGGLGAGAAGNVDGIVVGGLGAGAGGVLRGIGIGDLASVGGERHRDRPLGVGTGGELSVLVGGLGSAPGRADADRQRRARAGLGATFLHRRRCSRGGGGDLTGPSSAAGVGWRNA
jgi:hypothetical protein